MTAQKRDELVEKWIMGLTLSELRFALMRCAFALIDDEQIAYRYDDRMHEPVKDKNTEPDDHNDEGLYWTATGELINDWE